MFVNRDFAWGMCKTVLQDIDTVSIGRDDVAFLRNLLVSTVFPKYYLKNSVSVITH